MARQIRSLYLLLITAIFVGPAGADIFRWDNGQLVPGTEGIKLGPDVRLQSLGLVFADMRDLDLSGANLRRAILTDAKFTNSDLTSANLRDAFLQGTDFSDAVINGTRFSQSGITAEQYYTTASYKTGNLVHANLHRIDASDWDLSNKALRRGFFSATNLTGASLAGSDLTRAHFGPFPTLTEAATIENADFTGAIVEHTNFAFTGLSRDQLYSTASYQSKRLQGISLVGGDRSHWDLSGQDLTVADFGDHQARLAAADLSHADLSNSKLVAADLIGVNLSGANLAGADLRSACLDGAIVADGLMPTLTSGTRYNQWTTFPDWLDPEQEGLTFVESALGDFNEDGSVDADDYDMFSLYLGASFENFCVTESDMTDVSGDGRISFLEENDRRVWVKEIKGTWFGDANLDGEFNSTDLVELFQAGEYADRFERNSGWATGDWNGDREFDSADLVLAFQDGGYEMGPLSAAAAVPESAATVGSLLAFAMLATVTRRRRA